MYYLLILLFLLTAPTWGQPLLGLDLQVDPQGQHVQFGIVPEVFEQVTDYLETHPTQYFFIEDGKGIRYQGTIKHMNVILASKRILFTGTLDQPLSSLNPAMKVYLSLR